MATVTITIPDTIVPRLTTAMRGMYPQYSALTDVACFKKVTGDHWSGVLATWEAQQASINQMNQSTSDASGIG